MRKVSSILLMILALAAFTLIAACTLPMDSDDADVLLATVFGSMGGKVVDGSGFPIAGVTISYNTGARSVISTTTNENGFFEIKDMTSGDHTVVIGSETGKVPTTSINLLIHVPTIDELSSAVALGVVTDTTGTVVANGSLIDSYKGNYYVNVNSAGFDSSASPELFTVYPFTATLKGVAKLFNDGFRNFSDATDAPTGYRVIADFTDWNDSGLPLRNFEATVGTGGAFTLTKVPAIFDESGDIVLTLVSASGTSTITTFTIDGSLGNTTDTVEYPSLTNDGMTLPGKIRDLGTLYFVAAVPPKVITTSPALASLDLGFDPGTTTSRTPLVFTFDKAMDTTNGTIIVDDGTTAYNCVAVWSTNGMTLTITPEFPFENGQTITVLFENLRAADGVWYGAWNTVSSVYDASFDFLVRDALDLVKTSVDRPQTPAALTGIPIIDNVELTFNYTLTGYDNVDTYLFRDINSNGAYNSGTDFIVHAAISTETNKLIVNPASSLVNNASYVLFYSVTDGVTEATDTTTGVSFTTAEAAAAAAPTLALDTQVKTAASYNNGNTLVYVKYTKGAVDTTYSYLFRRRTTDEWTTGPTLNATGYDSTQNYAELTVTGGVISGETTEVKILAQAQGSTQKTASNALAITDGTAPTTAIITNVSVGPYLHSAGTLYTTFSAAGAPASDTKIFYRITTASEPIILPTVPTTAALGTIVTIDGMRQIDATTWWILATVKSGQVLAGAGTMPVAVNDGAGNTLAGGYTVTF